MAKILTGTTTATSDHPQVVTLLIDDSGSMTEQNKCVTATEGVQNLIIQMQADNVGSHGKRYIVNIAKFGDQAEPMVTCEHPDRVDLDHVVFSGDSGLTNMADALAWAAHAIQQSLAIARQVPNYMESLAPNPVVLFFSDGANTEGDPLPYAQALKSIPFQGGQVDVVAVGIGLGHDEMRMMQAIASRPELAVNIDPAQLADFLAACGQTAVGGKLEMPKMARQ